MNELSCYCFLCFSFSFMLFLLRYTSALPGIPETSSIDIGIICLAVMFTLAVTGHREGILVRQGLNIKSNRLSPSNYPSVNSSI